MKKIIYGLISLVLIMGFAGVTYATVNAVTPSTNDMNRTNGWAHVDQLSQGVAITDLQFISTRAFWSCFEYRVDNELNTVPGPNPNTNITDGRWTQVCVNNSSTTRTIHANEFVDVRMVYGAETDERFDWTRFDVLPNPDLDGDGVQNNVDFCPGTRPDTTEGYFSNPWGINRWYWNETQWIQQLNKNDKGGKAPFTMEQTLGCSCYQTLEKLKAAGLGNFGGHYKFGCSTSVLTDFVNDIKDFNDGKLDGRYFIETVIVPASKFTNTSSAYPLVNGMHYTLKARGTAMACNEPGCVITFDPEYSTSDATNWVDGVAAPYTSYGTDLLDLKVDGAFVNWGVYNPTHEYEISKVGTGSNVNLLIYDLAGSYSNDTGNLNVDIYANL